MGSKTNTQLSMIMTHRFGDYLASTSNYKLAPIPILHLAVLVPISKAMKKFLVLNDDMAGNL